MKEVSFILANVLWLFEVKKVEGGSSSGVLQEDLPGVGGETW